MIRCLRTTQGTASIAEYIVTFSLVVAVFVGMSMYLQRTLQGRLRDARHYVAENVRTQCNETNCVGKGAIGEGYEPYYVQANSEIETKSLSQTGLLASGLGTPGNFISRMNSNSQSQSNSQQLPPMNAVDDKVLGSL